MSSRLFLRATTIICVVLAVSCAVNNVAAEDLSLRERYRIVVSEDFYPQGTPEDTIRSIINAIENSNARYVLAHLVSPSQVDERLRSDVRELENLVAQMTPAKSHHLLVQLDEHLLDGEWKTGSRFASCQTEGLAELMFERIGDRWFMYNVSPRRKRPDHQR